MPLGGSGSEMLNSVKNNRKLSHRRKPLKQLLSENAPINTQKVEYTFKKATPEEMALLKQKIARDKRRSIVLRSILLITLTILGAYVLNLLFT